MRLFLLTLVCFCSLTAFCMAEGLSPEESVRWMLANPEATIIDVASKDSYKLQHFPGAINIPIENLPQEMVIDEYKKLPADQPVLLYDRTGMLSPRAWHELRETRPDLKEIYYIFGRPPFDATFVAPKTAQ